MYKLLIVSVLVALATARLSKPELDEEWVTYKKLYNKMYQAKEEVMRRLIWEQNLDFIQKHNLAFDRKEVTFTVGMNEYGDMTNEEFVKTMNGYKMSENRKPGSLYMPPSNIGDLPEKVDWRPQGYVTPIKNQGQCGSCWSFSATGSLEGQHFKANKSLVSLSEQNLVDCSRKQGNQGCQGGLMDQAFKYIKENNGIDTEASYPYTAKNGKCNFKPADVGATDTGYVDIKSKSESDLQSAVATVGPISVAIDASHMSFQLYRSGVYHSFFCSETRLDHGVLAVGYGKEGSEDYWIVKNSWGESWGQKGYIWMSRNRHNNCGIATQASYPTV